MIEVKHRQGGLSIRGSGGGGKGGGGSVRTPREQPDSLHSTSYATILDVISNGEVYGPVNEFNPLRDIFLDGTPIQNEDGSLNFRDVQVEVRHGSQNQSHIPGFPASSSVTQVGVEVKSDAPWSQTLTNPDLSAVRITLIWPALVRMIDSGDKMGDRVGTKVDYAIDVSTDGGSFQNVLTTKVEGKGRSYARTHRINLPTGSTWTVRVRRITPDSTTSNVENAMHVQSYAEVIDGKFVYPMTAVVGIKIDAEQFQAIPTRAYRWRGRLIRVPSNYDPEARTYSGVWDGTFKTAWSNNPAWVYYDMLTNKLYGLGDRVNANMIDRYSLYQIGAYCDQMVSDGQGGTEPRFVCNAYIQGQQDALRVLNDLTSVFRGMSYWAGGQVMAVADAPSDPVYTYTNANVLDGRFEYAGADKSTRKTVALVSWNDPKDFYRAKVEAVNDDDGILRYGIRKTEVTAFGCTSRAQAQRVGLYHLYTSRVETGGITFTVGLDGVIPQPGSIIRIADQNRAGRHIGGRIASGTTGTVIIDRDASIELGSQLTVNLPDGESETRPITSINGREITVSPAFSAAPARESVWAVDSNDLVTQLARVISVKETDQIKYQISAVAHHPDKFDAIDNGVRLEPLPVSVVPPRVQRAPENVQITEFVTYHQGTTRHSAEISFDAPDYAASYDIQWRRDQSDWVQIPRTGSTLVQIDDIYSGLYTVRVRAINALDVPSLWAYSDPTELDGMVGAPPTVTHLTTTGEIMAIRLDWGYPSRPSIIEKLEIRASLTNNFNDSYYLTEVAYPATSYTVYGLGYSTEMWFWVRLIDKNGTQGPWHPASTSTGVFGQPDQDPERLLEYLEGQIGQGQLAPGLLEEIEEGVTDVVLEDIIGDLTGDDVLDEKWYAGDDDDHFVGTVTTTSAYNHGDYLGSKRTTSLAAQMDTSLAVIREVQEVQASETMALAQEITTLSAKIDNIDFSELEAAIEINSQAIADIDEGASASWSVKTQVRNDGRVVQAGVALGASIGKDGQSRSEFLVMADTIAFLTKLNGQLHSPFVFDVANDTAFLDTAFIGTATIKTAHIENAAITSAKIKDGDITRAKIANAAINAAKIEDAAIKTAKIGTAQVDRLRISGGAVTYGNGFTFAANTAATDKDVWQTSRSGSFNALEASRGILVFNLSGRVGTNGMACDTRLLLNNAVIETVYAPPMGGNPSTIEAEEIVHFARDVNFKSGTNTISLQKRQSRSGYGGSWAIGHPAIRVSALGWYR